MFVFFMYNLFCRFFKVNVTAAGSFLGWHCAAVQVFCIYYFQLTNVLSCFGVGSRVLFVFSGLNLLCFVVGHLNTTAEWLNSSGAALVAIDRK
jgi:hypothetical protein